MPRKKEKGLEDKLRLKRKNGWENPEAKREDIEYFSKHYKSFLGLSKTERECVKAIKSDVEASVGGSKIQTIVNREKSIALVLRGTSALVSGVNIIVSHIDAPSLHLKQIPLLEDGNSATAVLKTHYYGGIKKYQWVSRPLALYGIVIKSDGKPVEICIGENPDEPVFFIPDLLPHLARKVQSEKKIKEAIPAEKMNVLAGSIPIKDKKIKERIKLQILQGLHEKYGLVEEDFISAELILVPTDKPRDVGFDRSLIMGYAHDDRGCSYASLRAILDIARENSLPQKTLIALFYDKEEIGCDGNTGAKSNFLENVLEEIGVEFLRKTLNNSRAISADVSAGVNPNWPEPHELTNAAKIGYGVVLEKFTGSGGKYMASDANAEFVGLVRNIFNQEKITWQYATIGKVDEGGGGTIAKFFAQRSMDIIDIGVPVLSMHAPLEIISKVDLYETYRGYKAFFEKA